MVAVALLAGCSQSASTWHVMTSEKGVGYKIGNDDWPAGTWETNGADGSQMCEWAMTADMTNTPSSVIDQGVVGHQPKRIAVKDGEFFVSHGCLPWRYLG